LSFLVFLKNNKDIKPAIKGRITRMANVKL